LPPAHPSSDPSAPSRALGRPMWRVDAGVRRRLAWWSWCALWAQLVKVDAENGLRGSDSLHQVLVFDAGSSGTRIHVFNLIASSSSGEEHVPKVDISVRSKQTKKVTPGLSAFAEKGDLDGAEQNIMELLKFANRFVAEAKRPSTPVLLKATAGLRAVSAAQAEAVIDRIRETLGASAYRFSPEWADIIQGKEEGGLAWVAANFLKGTFGEHSEGVQMESVGVIEMGGGSTQVTFQIDAEDKVAFVDDFIFETALGRKYRLYAHSYLGYGKDHARARLRERAPKSEVEDPCYAQGYSLAGASSSVHGAGDFGRCQANIKSRLMLGASGDAPGSYGDELPLRGADFVATESFFYTQDDLALGLEDRTLGEGVLETAAGRTCKIVFDRGADKKLAEMCFALSYEASLLKALKVWEIGATVKIVHKINGADVDWALGAALVHFLQGNAEPESVEVSQGFTMNQTVLGFVSLLAVAMAAVYVLIRAQPKQVMQFIGLEPQKLGTPVHDRAAE